MPSDAVSTGRHPAERITVVWIPVLSAGMCRTMTIDAGKSAGRLERIALSGSTAPAEPPMTTRSRLDMVVSWGA
jgi:hypothetical protein